MQPCNRLRKVNIAQIFEFIKEFVVTRFAGILLTSDCGFEAKLILSCVAIRKVVLMYLKRDT